MNSFSSCQLEDLLTKVNSGPSEKYESQNVEFKEYSNEKTLHSHSQDLAKELSALANKEGGVVIIGVRDSNSVNNQDWPSQLVGIEPVDELETEKRLCGNLRPVVELSVENCKFGNKNYVVIKVPRREETIVSTAKGHYYIRDGRDSRPLPPDELIELVKSLRKFDWSQDIIDEVEVLDCLDTEVLEQSIEEFANSKEYARKPTVEVFLESIGATIGGKLTKGGLLFLGREDSISQHIGGIEYQVTRKTRGGKLLFNEIWSGSLSGAILRMKKLFEKMVEYSEFDYDGKKYRFPSIDKQVFEEALINALVHRDYLVNGTTVVEFAEESLQIFNPGNFYGGVNAENIFIHQPRHRNRALSTIFMNCNLMDRAGMGTARMAINSLKYGREKPTFISRSDSVGVIIQSKLIKQKVFVQTSPFEECGIAELLIINALENETEIDYETLLSDLEVVCKTAKQDIEQAIRGLDFVQLVTDDNGKAVLTKLSCK